MIITIISLLILGLLLSSIGFLWLIVSAFKVSLPWGLAVFFLPFANLAFAIVKWNAAKKAIITHIAGLIIFLSGIALAIFYTPFLIKDIISAIEKNEKDDNGGFGIVRVIDSAIESTKNAISDNEKKISKSDGKPTGLESFIGMRLSEVRKLIGKPKGEMTFRGKTAWMYDDYMIISADGATVQSVILRKDFDSLQPAGDLTIQTHNQIGSSGTDGLEKVKTISQGGSQIDISSILVPGMVTIVDFYADWCGPCKVMAPDLEKLASNNPNVFLRKIDIVNWGTPVTKQYGISSIPNVRVYGPDGKMVGVPTHNINEITQFLKQALQ